MKRLLSISVTAGSDSTGRVAADVCRGAIEAGWEALLVHGRGQPHPQVPSHRMTGIPDMAVHGAATRLADLHGLASRGSTRRLIERIEAFGPDVINLHNIHGYYLNFPLLFDFLAGTGIPVVWTLHDCWAFTGHCAYFHDCRKWQQGCGRPCPAAHNYPATLLFSDPARNFAAKERAFNLPGLNLTLVGVSDWVTGIARQSMLRRHPSETIYNGVDTDVYTQDAGGRPGDRVLLGVARKWEPRKGLGDFIRLSETLPPDWRIRLVGLTKGQQRRLPSRIEAVPYIRSATDMAREYASATVFANLSYADAFPLTQLEALACGTPVVAFDSGGTGESLDRSCGIVIPTGSAVDDIARAIESASRISRDDCRARAVERFSLKAMQEAYLGLMGNLSQGQFPAQ